MSHWSNSVSYQVQESMLMVDEFFSRTIVYMIRRPFEWVEGGPSVDWVSGNMADRSTLELLVTAHVPFLRSFCGSAGGTALFNMLIFSRKICTMIIMLI